MKHAIVIGSGAGGATVAKELQGKFDVTVLESGKEFQPLSGLKRLACSWTKERCHSPFARCKFARL
jgi:choline dehydrogenase-like flavoprotein